MTHTAAPPTSARAVRPGPGSNNQRSSQSLNQGRTVHSSPPFFSVVTANDFSSLLEWKKQIAADIEHNKRYLPGVRTRGKIGVVYFELNINRAGWVLPGRPSAS
jgi:hypothetical protein